MVRARVFKADLSIEGINLLAMYLELGNAALVFISESSDQLGTLAASVPTAKNLGSQPFLSSTLLGDRNITITRALAERLAAKTGKIGLVSVHLKSVNEAEATAAVMKLFKTVTSQPGSIKESEQEEL